VAIDDGAALAVTLDESRYDRQERVSWWDQERLAAATVLVVGAGALGNEVVKNLALIGVGSICVIDIDTIEASNLARCVFFRSGDEGRPKAPTLAVRARELNPDVTIEGVVADIRSFGTGLFLRADVVVGALDNREARLYCNRLAARAGRSWVDGAIEALSGVARVFSPPDSCFECTLSEADWQVLAHRQSCRLLSLEEMEDGKVPTTATTSSIVGGIEAQEVMKLLHNRGGGVHPLAGAIVFDGANNDAYPLSYGSREDCLAHHRFDPVSVVDLPPDELAALTAADLSRIAWPEVGSEEPLVIELADDNVIGWRCTTCETTTPEHRPVSLISWGDAACAVCGEPRLPEFVTSIDVPGPHADRTLIELGIRIDEILSVRRGVEERYFWLAAFDERLPSAWHRATNPPTEAIARTAQSALSAASGPADPSDQEITIFIDADSVGGGLDG
jgi:adenylyltransferase/sulfurtransferase